MKKWMLIMIGLVLFYSCNKDKEEEKGKLEDGQLRAIVPNEYLKEAEKLGFVLHEGDDPPQIKGRYKIEPWRFDGDNYHEDGSGHNIGALFGGFVLNVSSQEGTSLEVVLENYYTGSVLTKPFIIGNGNKFTICLHTNMVGGPGALFNYPYMSLISGELADGTLKNVQRATIGLKLEHPNDGGLVVEGNVDLFSEADKVSERL